jgi:hypothetical protein
MGYYIVSLAVLALQILKRHTIFFIERAHKEV